METAIENLVSSVFRIVIGSFIWAAVLMLVVRWIQKLKVEYWNAYMTVLLAGILVRVLEFILFVAITAGTRSPIADQIAGGFTLPAYFFIQAGFVSYRIKIPFGDACLVTLITMIGIIFSIGALLILPILFINLFSWL